MAKQVNHVFAKTSEAGALYWHETAHADLDDAKSDAEELREGWQRARTKIVRGPDNFEWVRGKLDELNRAASRRVSMAPHEELERGGTYSMDETISLNHLRRFASAAFTRRLSFAVSYPTRNSARLHCGNDDATLLAEIVAATSKEQTP